MSNDGQRLESAFAWLSLRALSERASASKSLSMQCDAMGFNAIQCDAIDWAPFEQETSKLVSSGSRWLNTIDNEMENSSPI